MDDVGSPFERPRDPRVEGADLCRVEAGGKGRGHLADGDAAQLPRARLGHVERVLVVGRDAPPQLQQQPVTQQIGRALVPHHHDVPVVRHQRRPSTLVRMRNVEAPHLGAERALQKARDTVVRRATENIRIQRPRKLKRRMRQIIQPSHPLPRWWLLLQAVAAFTIRTTRSLKKKVFPRHNVMSEYVAINACIVAYYCNIQLGIC
mmetsp:Transcript_39818/g.87410  ORF Transcript_39818/g.87410 Transcript_39818/m.87410 type:complete len:205 (+) Transcript_39818:478-1092(+)